MDRRQPSDHLSNGNLMNRYYTDYIEDELPLPSFGEVFGDGKSYAKKKRRLSPSGNFPEHTFEEATGRWTHDEHQKFLQGIMLYGKDWKKMQCLIHTRTLVQIRTHAQKVFKRMGLKKINDGPVELSQSEARILREKIDMASTALDSTVSRNPQGNSTNNSVNNSNNGICINNIGSTRGDKNTGAGYASSIGYSANNWSSAMSMMPLASPTGGSNSFSYDKTSATGVIEQDRRNRNILASKASPVGNQRTDLINDQTSVVNSHAVSGTGNSFQICDLLPAMASTETSSSPYEQLAANEESKGIETEEQDLVNVSSVGYNGTDFGALPENYEEDDVDDDDRSLGEIYFDD